VARRFLGTVIRVGSIGLVSVYLAAVGVFLLVSRRIRVNPRGVLRAMAASVRPRRRAELTNIRHERGQCYVADLRGRLISDLDGRSTLVVLEDGRPLSHPHSKHDDIRAFGAGRYSHWGAAVFFSSADNTDPCTNGRRYTAHEG
jgi:hypothetical protein